MKILQVNCVYQKGSTGKIVYDIHKCLCAEGIESIVCYGRGKKINAPNVYKFCSEFESKVYHLLNKFGWLMYAVCPIATQRLIRIIKKEKPDVVHLHCINGFCVNIYELLKFLGRSRIKTIVTHHAEFFYTGNCGHAYECTKFQHESGCYDCHILKEATGSDIVDRTSKGWLLMRRAFSSFKDGDLLFTAVSPWVAGRSVLSPICNKFECKFVTNGLDTSLFHPATPNAIATIKSQLPHPEQRVILHVSASFSTNKDSIKRGYYIKQLAEMMPHYQFVVVASSILDLDGLPDNIYIWGRSKGQEELAALYSTADLTVIASKRETFSMVVAESLCCGTPVVGFESGGPESIGLKDCTCFVEFGNTEKLKKAVSVFVNKKWEATAIANLAALAYSKETMAMGYIRAYKELTHES